MTVIRETTSLCPECANEVPAVIEIHEGKACLNRQCPEHGSKRFVLSEHGEAYADLDRFYIRLNGLKPQGHVTNIWILVTPRCQQGCVYCSVDVAHCTLEDMTLQDVSDLMDRHSKPKVTLSGGEPTLYALLFDVLEEAKRRGVPVQIATNGIAMASEEFCRKLKDAGLNEVRLSMESFDVAEAERIGLGSFVKPKLQALENLERLGFSVTLSPTLFKGVSDEQIYHAVEYARDKPFIRQLSIGGFSWNGGGTTLPQSMMFTPDAMMDVLHRHYCDCTREEVYAFQKLMHAVMLIAGFRYCLNSQTMIFMRGGKKGLTPLSDYIHLPRLSRLLDFWVRIRPKNRLLGALCLAPLLGLSMRLRVIPYVPKLLRLVLRSMPRVDTKRFPGGLLVVVLNTNCSTLNADPAVSTQCTSATVVKECGVLREANAGLELMNQEKAQRKNARWQPGRGACDPAGGDAAGPGAE